MHSAGEVGILSQDLRGPEQHGRMPVMPAGMHTARDGGSIGQPGPLGQGERIHVRPKADGPLAGAPPLQRAHHTEATDTFRGLQPQAAQAFGDECSGAGLLHAEFGMSVDVAAHGDQLGEAAGDPRLRVVGLHVVGLHVVVPGSVPEILRRRGHRAWAPHQQRMPGHDLTMDGDARQGGRRHAGGPTAKAWSPRTRPPRGSGD
jgi:hypothetical protein